MADKISLDDIFDLNSFKALEEVQKSLVKASSSVNKQIKNQTKSLNELSASINDNEDALEKYLKLLNKASGTEITKLSSATDKLVDQNKKLNKQYEDQSKTLKKLEGELSKYKKAQSGINNFQKQRLALQEKIANSTKEEAKELAALRAQLNKNNKELRDNAKAALQAESAFKKLEKETREAKNSAKELGAKYGQTSKEFLTAQKRASKLSKELRSLNKSVGDNFDNVGNYSSALSGLGGALGLGGGIAGAVLLAQQGFSKFLDVTKDFEQQLARVQAVSGATGGEFDQLRDDALRLGASTSKTATDVGQLQEEFAKLGFSTDEIINATEATLQLSIATQSDLAEAATVAGATLRGFGLDARETGKVTDIMAKSFTTSALDLSSFRESMKFVAPVAKAAGVSIEETTALLGTLADAGIKGSSAGTALRRILSDMSATGKTASEAIKDLGEKGLTLNDAFDEVGRSAQTALLVLSENSEKADNLTMSYQNATGAAQEMANTVEDTLSGDLAKLESAFEGLLLSLGDSGLLGGIRGVVQGFTSLLSVLSGVQEETKLTISESVSLLDTQKKNLDRNKELVDSYEDLSSKVELTTEEKVNLDNITSELIDTYGDSIVEIDKETKAIVLNIDAIKEKIISEQILQSEEAKSILLRQRKAEQLIKEVKKAEEELTALGKKDIFVADILRAAKEGSFELQAYLANNQIDATKYAKTIERASFLTSNLFGSFAELDLAKSKEELKSLGLNLDDLAKSMSKVSGNKGGDNDDVKPDLSREKEAAQELLEFQKQQEIESLLNAEKTLKKELELIEIKRKYEISQEELTTSEIELINEQANKDKLDANEKYQKEKIRQNKEANEKIREDNENNQELSQLKLEGEINEVDTETKDFDLNKQRLEEKQALEEQKLKEQYEYEISLLEDQDQEKLILEEQYRQDLLDINEKYNNALIDQDKAAAEEQKRIRQEVYNSPVSQAVQQALLAQIENTVVLAGVEAVLNSLKNGDTAQEAASEGVQAVAAAQIVKSLATGFHDGGYTGDGGEWDIAGVTHKGEFVNTKKQTSEYGMKGWSANDFDNAVDTGYFNQFANTNKILGDSIPSNNIIIPKQKDIDYDKLGDVLASKIPQQDIGFFGDHLASQTKSEFYDRRTVYKSKKSFYKVPKSY